MKCIYIGKNVSVIDGEYRSLWGKVIDYDYSRDEFTLAVRTRKNGIDTIAWVNVLRLDCELGT